MSISVYSLSNQANANWLSISSMCLMCRMRPTLCLVCKGTTKLQFFQYGWHNMNISVNTNASEISEFSIPQQLAISENVEIKKQK